MGPKIHRNVQKCAKPFQTSSTLNRNCQRAIWRGPLCKTNLRVRPSMRTFLGSFKVEAAPIRRDSFTCAIALLLRYGAMNKAHTVTCFPSPAFGGSRSARWSTSNFNHWVCQNCATGRCPQSNLWFQTSCFQSKCGTNSKLCIVGYPIIPVIIAPTICSVYHC